MQDQDLEIRRGGGGGWWSPKKFFGSKNKGVPWPPLGPSLESATVKCNLVYEYCFFTVGIVEIQLSLEWFHKSRDCFFIDKNKLHCRLITHIQVHLLMSPSHSQSIIIIYNIELLLLSHMT